MKSAEVSWASVVALLFWSLFGLKSAEVSQRCICRSALRGRAPKFRSAAFAGARHEE